jgi:hypothetical protein
VLDIVRDAGAKQGVLVNTARLDPYLDRHEVGVVLRREVDSEAIGKRFAERLSPENLLGRKLGIHLG